MTRTETLTVTEMVWAELAGNRQHREHLTDHLDEWRAELARLNDVVSDELIDLKADEEEFKAKRRSPAEFRAGMAQFARDRKGILPRKRLIEGRLREVNALIKAKGIAQFEAAEIGHTRNVLCGAIRAHHAACEAAGLEPEPHDVALWAAVGIEVER